MLYSQLFFALAFFFAIAVGHKCGPSTVDDKTLGFINAPEFESHFNKFLMFTCIKNGLNGTDETCEDKVKPASLIMNGIAAAVSLCDFNPTSPIRKPITSTAGDYSCGSMCTPSTVSKCTVSW